MVQLSLSLLALAATVAQAWDAPGYAGFTRVWQDNFSGPAGQLPNEGNWNILQGDLGVNNELQVYMRNSRNTQVSGGDTLQLVPWRDGSQPKGWTSGRIESKYTFTPHLVRTFGTGKQAGYLACVLDAGRLYPPWYALACLRRD